MMMMMMIFLFEILALHSRSKGGAREGEHARGLDWIRDMCQCVVTFTCRHED